MDESEKSRFSEQVKKKKRIEQLKSIEIEEFLINFFRFESVAFRQMNEPLFTAQLLNMAQTMHGILHGTDI